MEDSKFSPKLSPSDAYKFLVCDTQVGTSNVDFQTKLYTFKRKRDGTYLINLGYTWEKLMFAARAIAAVRDPSEICIVSSRSFAQRGILKFAAHTGSTAIVGRFTPGSFTNQIQKNFKEPRLIVVSDPRADQQAVREASYVNIPVIAFVSSDSPLKHVDMAVPCNNKGIQSIGLLWWMLAREVLRLRGRIVIPEDGTCFYLDGREIMPDLYFYRDPTEDKKEEAVVASADDNEKDERPPTPEKRDEPMKVVDEKKPEPEKPEFNEESVGDWAAFENPEMAAEKKKKTVAFQPAQEEPPKAVDVQPAQEEPEPESGNVW